MTVYDVEKALSTMTERTVIFQMVKKEMQKRGHWKNKDRGISPEKMEERKIRRLNGHDQYY